MKEIERKFLVTGNEYRRMAKTQRRIAQGYLNTHPERTVRVRIADDLAYMTVKGLSNDTGTTRFEWEKEIPKNEAEALLELSETAVIDKTRYEVDFKGHVFEVDEFYGENEGLVIAEIELNDESESFEKPDWLGLEVTGDKRYYNACLSSAPYTTW
ncbi:CYTH domain-containing protein [Robertkochia solimangrovi]|uniref:CYTH domain-containing protein n=1 Tax=Robertkochia solimangrovi TaxID=2213046 RepID=UPI00118091BA|nr:CYTH domain-containing protein [Robertkochia solimangrovi]TRZ46496.1 adenylate cyclase [Robertkochia solimangrovi]